MRFSLRDRIGIVLDTCEQLAVSSNGDGGNLGL